MNMENRKHTTVLSAPTIVCGGCANAITGALGKLGGVANVTVDVDKKSVSVEHDDSVTEDALAGALDRAGFPATASA